MDTATDRIVDGDRKSPAHIAGISPQRSAAWHHRQLTAGWGYEH
jgi:hypothetical protein